MTEILEIRDDCKTPSELIESKTFSKYLEIYKKKFINDLNTKKGSDQNEEAFHKIEFILEFKYSWKLALQTVRCSYISIPSIFLSFNINLVPQSNFSANLDLGLTILQKGVTFSMSLPAFNSSNEASETIRKKIPVVTGQVSSA